LKTDRRKNLFFSLSCSIATGIILSFAFPPSATWQIAFLAMIPLLISAGEDSWRNLLSGITAGFVFYVIVLSWLYNVAGPIYLLLALYLSVYWGVFLYLVFALPEKGRIFTAAFVWCLLEIIMSGLLTGFPWLLLGVSQWQNGRILKIAGLCGTYGISFVIVLVNLTVFYAFRKRYVVSFFVSAIVLIGICFLPGQAVYHRISSTGSLNIMVIQPDIDASIEENPYTTLKVVEAVMFENMEKDRRPDIVIWPEGSFPDNIDEYSDVLDGLKTLCKENDFRLILGTFTGTEKAVYNSSLLVGGDSIQVYRKNRLVPYGEFILGGRCRVIRNIYEKIAEYIPVTIPGRELTLFTLGGNKKIAPLICFENVFPDMAGGYVREGGELFVVITNDSWFGRSAGPCQHFAHNALRAAETGRYFVQGSLSGISGVVSPAGVVENTIRQNGEELFVKGALYAAVPLVCGETFYSQTGDIPLFILSVIFTGVILCRHRR